MGYGTNASEQLPVDTFHPVVCKTSLSWFNGTSFDMERKVFIWRQLCLQAYVARGRTPHNLTFDSQWYDFNITILLLFSLVSSSCVHMLRIQ